MDEINSIRYARMESGSVNSDSEVQRTMLELLNQLNGFEASNKIKVLIATIRVDIFDEALIKPGRIDRKIEFPNPIEEVLAFPFSVHCYMICYQPKEDIRHFLLWSVVVKVLFHYDNTVSF